MEAPLWSDLDFSTSGSHPIILLVSKLGLDILSNFHPDSLNYSLQLIRPWEYLWDPKNIFGIMEEHFFRNFKTKILKNHFSSEISQPSKLRRLMSPMLYSLHLPPFFYQSLWPHSFIGNREMLRALSEIFKILEN